MWEYLEVLGYDPFKLLDSNGRFRVPAFKRLALILATLVLAAIGCFLTAGWLPRSSSLGVFFAGLGMLLAGVCAFTIFILGIQLFFIGAIELISRLRSRKE